jgi:hypothetical protein
MLFENPLPPGKELTDPLIVLVPSENRFLMSGATVAEFDCWPYPLKIANNKIKAKRNGFFKMQSVCITQS